MLKKELKIGQQYYELIENISGLSLDEKPHAYPYSLPSIRYVDISYHPFQV